MLLNKMLAQKKAEVDGIILKLEDEGKLASMSALEIRDHVMSIISPAPGPEIKQIKVKEDPDTFLKWYDRFTERKDGRTKQIYKDTRARLVAWKGEEWLAKVKFEDIKIAWLEDLNDFLAKTCKANTIAIHMRNVRAVVNYAIDNEITTQYAFRRYQIKTEPTRKRNFDIDTLRRIFSYECEEEWQQKYLDFFKLSFMLVGINVKDLCNLDKITGGRVEYIRAKTHRPYSIKVESEARALIERYAGKDRLVNFSESYANYRHFYNNLCKGLKEVKTQLGIETLTTYWARHTWATIAVKLGVSKDIVALALGHGQHTVTDIYIEYDMEEVDKANRKVLDHVLYGGASSRKRKPSKKA